MTTTSSTTSNRSTVVGVFEDPSAARRAIDALKEAGFRGDDISVLTPEKEDARAVAEDTGTHAGGGAATGAVVGGLLGGLGGWLIGIGALAIPGVGPFIAAGAFATALGGAAVGAGVGAVAGALVGMGVPQEHAEYYEGEVRQGRSLVTVRAPQRYDEAQRIMRQQGAYDIETRDQPRTAGRVEGGREAGTATRTADTSRPASGQQRLELREEQLQAQKQQVETGEVTLGKEIVSEERTLNVPVTREEVYVERRAVDREPADRPIESEAGRTIEIPVREERAEVEKRPVVYEEVGVDKKQVTDTQQVSATVRREEARIEQEGNAGVAGAGWSTVESRYRQRWQSRAGTGSGDWQSVEPSYRYAYEMRNRPEYRGQQWSAIEPRLRSDWERTHPETPWDRARGTVQDAWEEPA
ncbi:MAG: YsnF/AvaK domain-containing protein [Chloroflexi bacterium]|nr:YsnF/AvaK domain-containing protein [Chloroflexota bacterium]